MEDFLPLMVVTVSDVAPNENNSRDRSLLWEVFLAHSQEPLAPVSSLEAPLRNDGLLPGFLTVLRAKEA